MGNNFRDDVKLYKDGILTDLEFEARFLWAINDYPHFAEDYFGLLPEAIKRKIRIYIDRDDLGWFQTLGTGLPFNREWFENPSREAIEARLASREALREFLH